MDIIGPYKVKTPTKVHKLLAMTMIDPATGWFEVAPIEAPSSDECQVAFDSYWLARYPRPTYVGCDNGSSFKGLFIDLCKNYGIDQKYSTEYNPQSNGIIERVHQVLGNALRSFELQEQELDKKRKWEPFLTAASYAIRSTFHTTLNATPAQLVYGRDMLLPMKFVADWTRIQQSKQDQIHQSNVRENSKQIPHQYQVGDQVLIQRPGISNKLSTPHHGPYPIVQVHTNGTVNICNRPVQQQINILTPYIERAATIGKRMT